MTSATVRPDRPLLHLVLLGLTVLTTFTAFLFNFSGVKLGALTVPALHDALLFSLTLVAILGCHEMGHYFFARYHRVDTSLPYFIPMPVLGVGTLGAVIRIRGQIPHRDALVDIGAAGPLAGLAVAIPCLLVGFSLSTVEPSPLQAGAQAVDTSLWSLLGLLHESLSARLAGAPAAAEPLFTRAYLVFGDNLVMTAAQWAVLGPLPEGADVNAHPMVIAAWFGLLVTMLNLVPVGQLDGGHLTYAMFGRGAERLGKLAAFGIFGLMMFASVSWAVWLLVAAKLVGFRHPPVLDERAPLSTGRRWVCALCLLAFVACLIPVPLSQVLAP